MSAEFWPKEHPERKLSMAKTPEAPTPRNRGDHLFSLYVNEKQDVWMRRCKRDMDLWRVLFLLRSIVIISLGIYVDRDSC